MTESTAPKLSAEQQQQLAPRETSAMVLAAQAKALVEARYVVAMRNPRDLDIVRERMIKESQRPSFAPVAMYAKPVGGSTITGPSIRFAEMAMRCMTNIVVDTPAVYDDTEKRIVRVSVTDLEANVSYTQDVTIQKSVERNSRKDSDVVLRTRTGSRGQTVYVIEATDDDIQNKQNALISKAIRTLGLRIIPGDMIDECLGFVIDTMKAKDAKDPDGERYKLFDAFGTIGITVEQIKEYLGHDGKTLQPKELADLRALFTAIKDGEATWREAMEARGMAAPQGAEGKGKPSLRDLTDKLKGETANTGGPPDEVARETVAATKVHEEPHGRPAGEAAPASAAGRQRRF